MRKIRILVAVLSMSYHTLELHSNNPVCMQVNPALLGVIAMIPWLITACFYPCILGPDFWGLVNKHWRMCTSGQMQSPINIDPSLILFDPGLAPFEVDKNRLDATFENIGQLPLVTINDSLVEQKNINISGGPTAPYKYRLHHIVVHFGQVDRDEKGSEHTIDRVRFPAEVQLLAYNSDLYANFTEAMSQPRGLLAISVIVDIGAFSNTELRKLTVASQSITYKGSKTILKKFSAHDLLPETEDYITYEGSLTFPGCFETVTWIIMNNPIYITKEDLQIWNDLQQTENKEASPAFMFPNYRPLKPLNGRLLRTNINLKYKTKSPQTCLSNLYVDMGYKANPKRSIDSMMYQPHFESRRLRSTVIEGHPHPMDWELSINSPNDPDHSISVNF